MEKLRFQPTFASLTEAELEQLACDVQREPYDAVRIRICKPRSEGGLDLHFTSNSPLFGPEAMTVWNDGSGAKLYVAGYAMIAPGNFDVFIRHLQLLHLLDPSPCADNRD